MIDMSNIIIWRVLEINNNILILVGKDKFWMPEDKYFYYCKIGDNTFYPKYYEYSNYDSISIYGAIRKGRIVVFEIPLFQKNQTQILKFFISCFQFNEEILTSLGCFSHIPPISDGYYISENYIIKFIENRFVIYQYRKDLHNIFEKNYCRQLKSLNKIDLIHLRSKSINYRFRAKNKYKIWLINDRHDQAGDNGEYFFRYLKNKNYKGIKIYFTIDKNCSDYQRLYPLGDILDLNSRKYLNIFLIADKIISSISNSWVTNPFNDDYQYIRDLPHFDNIFLQHGIIKDDLSNYLNWLNKKYDYFVTSSKKEYKSMLNYKYGYNKNNIILTGLPRYDNLQRLKNKINFLSSSMFFSSVD